MPSQTTAPTFFWRSCGEPSAAWFLVWMPFVLLALEDGSSLGSAMIRLLAVLLVAALIWARGLGPSGLWPERFFVGVWAAAWTGALGLLVTAGGWPSTSLGNAALLAALLVGAAWLSGACQMRQDLRKALSAGSLFGREREPSASSGTIVGAWLLTAGLFALALSVSNAHWADGVVLVLALGGFTLFQRGGLAPVSPSGS